MKRRPGRKETVIGVGGLALVAALVASCDSGQVFETQPASLTVALAARSATLRFKLTKSLRRGRCSTKYSPAILVNRWSKYHRTLTATST